MKTSIRLVLAGAIALASRPVSAAPAWCKDADAGAPDLSDLSSNDPRRVLHAFVGAACAPSPEVEAHRADIEKARAAWSKRLGLQEADWADVAAYVKYPNDYAIRGDVSTQDLAAMTPLDQYLRINKAIDDIQGPLDSLYTADIFEPNLSEAGRLALIEDCLKDDTGHEVMWAVCQQDIEHFDASKLFDQVRGDTRHAGELRMKLRMAAYNLPARLAEHAEAVAALRRQDDAWAKAFELASKARAEWATTGGKETRLLALASRLESGTLARSRKMLADCDQETYAALGQAASGIPAKTFLNMKDIRDEPHNGFAKQALPLLVRNPQFHLAAIAVALCNARPALAGLLASALADGPGSRGPRDLAYGRIKTANLQLDKVGATIYFEPRRQPYGRSGSGSSSAGGAVDKVSKSGNVLVVKLQPLMVKREECVKEHQSNRIERIRDDGSVAYELVCEKSAVVAHDEQWAPIRVAPSYETSLKAGSVISVATSNDTGDVIAIWPSAKASLPSWVFGGTVK